MTELVKPAIDALKDGRVRSHPEQQTSVMLSSPREHPAVVHFPPAVVGAPDPRLVLRGRAHDRLDGPAADCAECGKSELTQEEDVLDTWFSSALWPFATLGWPEETPDLQTFYPGDVCSTGRDINFLWVSRMIWAGLELMGDVPFHDVNYHAMILAPDGRRMSKSLGTGIDPTELIAEHGADSTRYGLLKMASTQDVRFSAGAIGEGRKLSNKLWNVARLMLGAAGDADAELRPRDVEERWILARLDSVRAELETLIPEFEFSPRDRLALSPDVRRFLRLVRGGDQAAPVRRRCGRTRDGARRARTAA